MKAVVVLLLALLLVAESAGALFSAENEIFSFGVGDFKVHMLSEAQRDSGLDILIGMRDGDAAKFIPSGKYPSAVAAYLIESPDGAVMVDTGFGREIPRLMKSLGFAASDIKTVLITHAHGDHIGGLLAEGKPAFPNARVLVSKAEYEWSEQLRDALSKYGDAYETVTPGDLGSGGAKIMDGISAIAAYGHTPGHTMFMLESRGGKLLIWGDLTHAMAVQMPRPGVSVKYDSDPDAAARVRADVLKYISENKIPAAGMHVAYPGVGDISPDADNPGGYKFTPKN